MVYTRSKRMKSYESIKIFGRQLTNPLILIYGFQTRTSYRKKSSTNGLKKQRLCFALISMSWESDFRKNRSFRKAGVKTRYRPSLISDLPCSVFHLAFLQQISWINAEKE